MPADDNRDNRRDVLQRKTPPTGVARQIAAPTTVIEEETSAAYSIPEEKAAYYRRRTDKRLDDLTEQVTQVRVEVGQFGGTLAAVDKQLTKFLEVIIKGDQSDVETAKVKAAAVIDAAKVEASAVIDAAKVELDATRARLEVEDKRDQRRSASTKELIKSVGPWIIAIGAIVTALLTHANK